jgi:hypothetical protein
MLPAPPAHPDLAPLAALAAANQKRAAAWIEIILTETECL